MDFKRPYSWWWSSHFRWLSVYIRLLLMMGVLFCCGAGFFIRRRMYPSPLSEEPAFNVSFTRHPVSTPGNHALLPVQFVCVYFYHDWQDTRACDVIAERSGLSPQPPTYNLFAARALNDHTSSTLHIHLNVEYSWELKLEPRGTHLLSVQPEPSYRREIFPHSVHLTAAALYLLHFCPSLHFSFSACRIRRNSQIKLVWL